MKIGMVASSGGHWEELMCLKCLGKKHTLFYVTEKGGQAAEASVKPIYLLDQINRHEKDFIVQFIKLFIIARKILRMENPDVIVTTGALISYPFCVVGKLMGKKIIYIESFARISDKSLTGKLVYPFSDLFLVQWKEMKKVYPKAEYVGSIF